MTSRFVDEYAPPQLPGYPCISIPTWSTQIVRVASGDEQANQKWENPLHVFTLPNAVRLHEHYAAVAAHWYAMRGPAHTWPFRDPLDFASVTLSAPNVVPSVSATDCLIGTGDGALTEFQLVKRYASGSQFYDRPIYFPVLSTVVVSVDGSPASPTVSRPGGVVTFASAPGVGAVIKAGFLFDVQVRFENDESFSGVVKNWQTSGFSDLTLVEVRNCADDD